MFYHQSPENKQDEELEEAIALFSLEAQVILFGSFAVLGFQIFAQYVGVALQRPGSSRYTHIASISLVALTILWTAPVAFPSDATWAQSFRHLYRTWKRDLTMASALLAMAIAGEIYVVTRVELHSYLISLASAFAMLAVACACWFVLPLHWKRRNSSPPDQ